MARFLRAWRNVWPRFSPADRDSSRAAATTADTTCLHCKRTGRSLDPATNLGAASTVLCQSDKTAQAEHMLVNHVSRRIRLSLAIHTDATPDERPLERRESEILRKHVPRLRVRFFDLLGRWNRFVLVAHNYENSSAPRRILSNAIASVDWVILTIPGLRNLAGQAVFWGYTAT